MKYPVGDAAVPVVVRGSPDVMPRWAVKTDARSGSINVNPGSLLSVELP